LGFRSTNWDFARIGISLIGISHFFLGVIDGGSADAILYQNAARGVLMLIGLATDTGGKLCRKAVRQKFA
jgi:hypothetical protein